MTRRIPSHCFEITYSLCLSRSNIQMQNILILNLIPSSLSKLQWFWKLIEHTKLFDTIDTSPNSTYRMKQVNFLINRFCVCSIFLWHQFLVPNKIKKLILNINSWYSSWALMNGTLWALKSRWKPKQNGTGEFHLHSSLMPSAIQMRHWILMQWSISNLQYHFHEPTLLFRFFFMCYLASPPPFSTSSSW